LSAVGLGGAVLKRETAMDNKHRKMFGMLLILCLILSTVSGCMGSPLVTGTWDGDTFTNQWTHITFELPSGFEVLSRDRGPGWVDDFTIMNDDARVVIGLTYTDISHRDFDEYTAEDYLGIIRESLLDSQSRDFTFANDFELVTIAGREYVLMRGAYTYKDNPTEGAFHDIYAHRFVNTMMIFIAVYDEDARETVDAFLSSIGTIR